MGLPALATIVMVVVGTVLEVAVVTAAVVLRFKVIRHLKAAGRTES